MDRELDPADAITVDAVGEPGRRTFYLQATSGDDTITLLLEKQQVAALAQEIDELLTKLGDTPSEPPSTPAPELREPLEARFRVGAMGIGYDADRDRVLLECREFVPEPDEDDAEERTEVDPSAVRIWTTREQVHALARRGEAAVSAGRPTCTMCGSPMDPGGHFCPASNGHQKISRLS